PQSLILHYGSIKYNWVARFQPVYEYIYVGHGDNENGVQVQNQIVTWKDFAKITNKLNPIRKTHLLICGSSSVKAFSNDIGVSFSNEIDAKTGALYISTMKYLSDNIENKAINSMNKLLVHIKELRSGNSHPKMLYLTGEEMYKTLADTIALMMITILEFYRPPAFWRPFSINIYTYGKAAMQGLHLALIAYDIVKSSSHLLKLFRIVVDHGLCDFLMDNLNWVDAIEIVMLITATLALGIVTVGGSIEIAMGILIFGCWAVWLAWFIIDSNDIDSEWHETLNDGGDDDGGGGGGRPPLFQ
ncbi:MAG: hypothetical protein ACTSYA_04855, partial [Candidatus Kariarchaeaceae archaeon]